MQVADGASLPTIRFYAWEQPTVSLGYFQRATRELEIDKIKQHGFSLVRRMTGGRAVLHDRELTYSVMVPATHELAQASVVESYRMLSEGLRQGFLALGLQAQIVSLADETERQKYATMGSAACFDSPSWYELVVEGKKIAGSAQVRAHGGLLQHGALLLDMNVDELMDIMIFPNEKRQNQFREEFLSRASSVKQLSGRDVSYSDAASAFAHGFAEGLTAKLTTGKVSDAEIGIATALQRDKYEDDSWTFRR